MKITPQCVVALTWTLKDTLGEVLDELDEPLEFLLGGQDLLVKIEEYLKGHEAGDALAFQLEPEQAFGDYDENLVFLEPRVLFPAELEEGMTIDGATLPMDASSDTPKNNIYTITEIYPEHIVLDGNHPLGLDGHEFPHILPPQFGRHQLTLGKMKSFPRWRIPQRLRFDLDLLVHELL